MAASLYDLGVSYLETADLLQAQIDRRRLTLQEPEVRFDRKRAYSLRCELRALYSACREARETGAYLMHYYEPHGYKTGRFSV